MTSPNTETPETIYFMACKPKTGNTFVRRVLQRYWGRLGLRGENSKWGGVGQKKIDLDIVRHGLRQSVRSFYGHLLPDERVFNPASTFSFRVVILERNLWDSMVSWVDHQTQFEDSPREKIELDFVLEWTRFFLDFSINWRKFSRADESLILNYDDFLADKYGYIKSLAAFLDPETLDEDALREAFEHYDKNTDRAPTVRGSVGHRSDVKFNVGVSGRGREYRTNPIYQKIEAHLLDQAPEQLEYLFRFPD